MASIFERGRKMSDDDERLVLLKVDADEKENGRWRNLKQKLPNFEQLTLVISAILLNGFTFGFGNCLTVLYPELVRVFHAERQLAALVQGLNMSLSLAGSVVWTPLVKRYGYGFCIKCGVIVAVLGVFLGNFSTNIWMMIIFVGVVTGIGNSIVNVAPLLLLNLVLPEVSWKPAALAVLPIGSSMFQFLFILILENLLEQYGWQGSVLIMSAILANMMLFAIKLHEIEKLHIKRFGKLEDVKTEIVSRDAFKNIRLYIYAFLTLLFGFAGFVESRFLVDLIILKGYPRATGSLVVSYLGMANFSGRIVGVVLKLFIPEKSVWQIILFNSLNGCTHAIILYYITYTGIHVGAILNGFTYGLVISQWTNAIREVFTPEEFAPAMVAMNFVGGVGSFFDSFIGGYIQDTTNSYDLLFELAIAFTVIIVVLFLVLKVLSSHKYRHVCRQ